MNGFESDDRRPDGGELDKALQELEAGTLDPSRRDELMALVNRSPAAQRAYLEYFEISALLGTEAAIHAERGNLPKIVNFEPPQRLFRRSLLAAAALVAVGAVVAALIQVARPEVPELALTAAADTRWSVQGEVRDVADRRATVREGSSVRVDSGTLELRFESGASMVLQGPAHVSFPKLSQPVVRAGWLWIDSGPSHQGFEVRTPELRVRNLGTRFGVRVQAGEPAELHLVRGKLAVTVDYPRRKVLELVADGQGLAIPALGETVARKLAGDPFPQIAGLLAAAATYPTAVLGQNPAAYWRFDKVADGRLANEVDGESAGGIEAGVVLPCEGPGPAEGLQGFDPSNRSLRLTGGSGDSRLSLGAGPRHEGLLFRQSFGGTGPLDQRRPETAMVGAFWTAAPQFLADGTILAGKGSATLPFQPVDGVVYVLEAALRGVTVPAGIDDWVALGFARGQSAGTGNGHRFVDGMVAGRAWMLFRGKDSGFENTALLAGTSDTKAWRNWSGGSGGDVDLRVVLDTRKGSGNWTASWFARRPGDGGFVNVRETCRLPSEALRTVGIAVTGQDIRARITDFSLRAEAAAPHSSSRFRAEGPAPLQRRAGALSCWLRREPGGGPPRILWSAGEDGSDDAIHARIEADGRVGFFIENGRYDVLLTSEEALAEGRWHHLAASWSPDTVDLYLDGRRIAWERESRDLLHGALPELRVGGGPQGDRAAFFAGDIDEVALWNRNLTSVEVAQQYRSARDGAKNNGR
jgi:ferric-dicitrate binding protein FerR (iron transport regulator)